MAILPLQPDLAMTSALVHCPMCVMRTTEAKVGGVTGRVGSLANRCVTARASTEPEYSDSLFDERDSRPNDRSQNQRPRLSFFRDR